MNATKQKILVKSLNLFNELGITAVSLRMIADEAEISIGNLQYHFKKREEIVEALYFQLIEKVDQISAMKTEDLLRSFLHISTEMISRLFEYRFFFLDFVAITRRNQKIKQHYSELSKRREAEFLMIAEVLIQNGFFREEVLKHEYHSLYKRTELVSNFWFSSLLIQADELSKASIQTYTFLINQSLYPYLTEEGKKRYAGMFPEQIDV